MADLGSTHFDRKLIGILRRAAEVFCARGYHRASIREIARATGVSLAGLYYYFRSKEELLYLIQRHTFETILQEARAALRALDDPQERLRTFILLHLKFFLDRPNEMKVLTHESDSLADRRRREVNALKSAYYRLCLDQVEALKQERKLKRLNTRVAVFSLFGMMNWIYTWYRRDIDPDAETMAGQMAEIFLGGIGGPATRRTNGTGVLRAVGGKQGNPRSAALPAGRNGKQDHRSNSPGTAGMRPGSARSRAAARE